MKLRRGRNSDLSELTRLEAGSFEAARRDSDWMTRHSLTSPHQEVWVLENGPTLAGCLILRFWPHTCRIHSIAVDPNVRGAGHGRRLLRQAHRRARARGCRRMSLEADARNEALLVWYEQNGYSRTRKLSDYYARRWHAWRFSKAL